MYSTYPVKWCIILAVFIIFWNRSIILLGHHFSGSRCYFLVAHHFTETSFYWNNFVLQIWVRIILRFHFLKINIVHHFTGSLLLHWNYPDLLPKSQQIFSHKTRWRRTERAFSVGNRHCSTTSIIFLNSSPKPYSWVVSDWNITNPQFLFASERTTFVAFMETWTIWSTVFVRFKKSLIRSIYYKF